MAERTFGLAVSVRNQGAVGAHLDPAWLPIVVASAVVPFVSREGNEMAELPRASAGAQVDDIPELVALCGLYDDWNQETCYGVGFCEMGGYWNPQTRGNADEVGVFQIHPVHRDRVEGLGYEWRDLDTPAVNVIVAHSIWEDNRHFGPWSCWNGGY